MRRTEALHRVNRKIRAPEVTLVDSGVPPTVYKLSVALSMAEERGEDLVEMSAKTSPPICKIFDYNKFIYEQEKKAKLIGTKEMESKELKFRLRIDKNDFAIKINHAKKFLEKGFGIRGMVQLIGREPYTHQKEAQAFIASIVETLSPYGTYKVTKKASKGGGAQRRLFFAIDPLKRRSKIRLGGAGADREEDA